MADVREREKIVREIEKTSESIRKKHRALKTGRIEEGIALDRHFKPLIEPLRLFADNPGERATKRESRDEDAASAPKRERKEEEEQKEREKASETFEPSATLHKSSDRSREPITSTPRAKIVPTIESLENVFETTEDSLATKVQNQLQTSEGREALRANLGPLGQKYVEAVLRGAQDKESGIDHVYGVYLYVLTTPRFIARRGKSSIVYTDNGINFVGTRNLLRKINWEKVKQFSTSQKIDWRLNPPTAAWWERMVRIVKDLLKRTLKKSCLSYEELSTILCNVEAVINSRPLTYVAGDQLKPSMFLQEISQNSSDIILIGQDNRKRLDWPIVHIIEVFPEE
ncbi:hypothetical protein ALC57_13238 [Trachymyrmex cornetzi]|uniref:Integrase catalytic domain-containing protein n=1 Tax=Trachymyrmex cornetzi TaxID=471704 RepID=A0A151IZQ4_9HYME|nr:hypothetical protein ALC57_13238 [Trachymyrmex cornetzi]